MAGFINITTYDNGGILPDYADWMQVTGDDLMKFIIQPRMPPTPSPSSSSSSTSLVKDW